MASFGIESELNFRKIQKKKKSSGRRSSILKPSKSPARNALSDLDPNSAEETEAGTKTIRKSRRVSFAEKCLVKEFMTEPGTTQDWSTRKNETEENLDYPPKGQITGLENLLTGPIQSHTFEVSGPIPTPEERNDCPVDQPTGNRTVIGNISMDITQCYLDPPHSQPPNLNVSSIDSKRFLQRMMTSQSSQISNRTRLFDEDMTDNMELTKPIITDIQTEQTWCTGISGQDSFPTSRDISNVSQFSKWDCTETKVYGPDETCLGFGEKTHIFLNEDTGIMDITSCVGGMVPNETNRSINKSSTIMDRTKLFDGNRDCGDMELTTCIGSMSVVDKKSAEPAPAYNVSHFAPECFASPVAKVQARSFLSKLMGSNSPIQSPNLANIYSDKGADLLPLYKSTSDNNKVNASHFLAMLSAGQGFEKPVTNVRTVTEKNKTILERTRTFSDGSDNMDLTGCIDIPPNQKVSDSGGINAEIPCRSTLESTVNKTRIFSSSFDEITRQMDFTECVGNIDLSSAPTTLLDKENISPIMDKENIPHKDTLPPKKYSSYKAVNMAKRESSERPPAMIIKQSEGDCVQLASTTGKENESTEHSNDPTVYHHDSPEMADMSMTECLLDGMDECQMNSKSKQKPEKQANKTVHFQDQTLVSEMEMTSCVEKSIRFGNVTHIGHPSHDAGGEFLKSKHMPSSRGITLVESNKTVIFEDHTISADMEITSCVEKNYVFENKTSHDQTGGLNYNNFSLACNMEMTECIDKTIGLENEMEPRETESTPKVALFSKSSKYLDNRKNLDGGASLTTGKSVDNEFHTSNTNQSLPYSHKTDEDDHPSLKRRFPAQHSNAPVKKVAKFNVVIDKTLLLSEDMQLTRVEDPLMAQSSSSPSTESDKIQNKTRLFFGQQDRSAMMDMTECQGGIEEENNDVILTEEVSLPPVDLQASDNTRYKESSIQSKPTSMGKLASVSSNNSTTQNSRQCKIRDRMNVLPGSTVKVTDSPGTGEPTSAFNNTYGINKELACPSITNTLTTMTGCRRILSGDTHHANARHSPVTGKGRKDLPVEREVGASPAEPPGGDLSGNKGKGENTDMDNEHQQLNTSSRKGNDLTKKALLSNLDLSRPNMSLFSEQALPADSAVRSISGQITDKTLLLSEDMQLTRVEDPLLAQSPSSPSTESDKIQNKTRLFFGQQDRSAMMDMTECQGGIEEENNDVILTEQVSLPTVDLQASDSTSCKENITQTLPTSMGSRSFAGKENEETFVEKQESNDFPNVSVSGHPCDNEDKEDKGDEFNKHQLSNLSTRSRNHSSTNNKSLSLLDLSRANTSLLPKITFGANSISCLDEMANHSLIPDGGPKTIDDYLALLGVHFHDQPTMRWSTRVDISAKSADTISEKLQIVVPELEVHSLEWACQQMSQLIDRYHAMNQEICEHLMTSPPELLTLAVSDPSVTSLVQALHLTCCKRSKIMFKKWRMKMVDGLLQELKQEQQHLSQANEEMSMAVESAQLSIKSLKSAEVALDDLMSSVRSKKLEIKTARIASSERKSLSRDWQVTSHNAEEKEVQKREYIAEQKNLESHIDSQLEELASLTAASEGSEYTADTWMALWENIQQLQRGLKYEIESWNEDFATFTFFYGLVRLKVQFLSEKSAMCGQLPHQIAGVTIHSTFDEDSSPLVCLAKEIFLAKAESFTNPSLYTPHCRLQQVLHQISLLACVAEDLLHDLEYCDLNNDVSIHCSSIRVVFSNLKAHAKFVAVFHINPSNYPWELAKVELKNLIGNTSLDELQKALVNIEPGYSQLRRAVVAIENSLNKNISI